MERFIVYVIGCAVVYPIHLACKPTRAITKGHPPLTGKKEITNQTITFWKASNSPQISDVDGWLFSGKIKYFLQHSPL